MSSTHRKSKQKTSNFDYFSYFSHTVKIHIDEVDIEAIHDYLTIHDGPFENATELQ